MSTYSKEDNWCWVVLSPPPNYEVYPMMITDKLILSLNQGIKAIFLKEEDAREYSKTKTDV